MMPTKENIAKLNADKRAKSCAQKASWNENTYNQRENCRGEIK